MIICEINVHLYVNLQNEKKKMQGTCIKIKRKLFREIIAGYGVESLNVQRGGT